MVYVAVALYYEAEPLIRLLGLKKNGRFDKFQVFEGRAAVLIVTGAGEISAAAAVAYLCASFSVSRDDIFINYGICAAGGLSHGAHCILYSPLSSRRPAAGFIRISFLTMILAGKIWSLFRYRKFAWRE